MKKLYFTLFFTICILISCKEKSIDDNIPIVYPRGNMACLIDSFIHGEKISNEFNEIYVNKRTPWQYGIIIYSGEVSLSESASPLARINRNGVIFDLYSGIEHYFGTTLQMPEINDMPRKEGSPNGSYWIIEDKEGELEITKDLWVIPFYSVIDTGVKFTPASPIFDNE